MERGKESEPIRDKSYQACKDNRKYRQNYRNAQ